MAAEQWVTLDWIEGGIGRLTIAREKALNALNPDVLAQLEERLDRLEASDQTRVVIVTGQGSRAFVAGADISFIHNLENEQAGSAFALRGQKLFQRFQQSRLLFIAAINGYCLGGGLELAMALDFRIAADTAKLGQPEVNLGLIPGFGGTQRLTRLVGPSQAMWLMACGDPVTADEAFRLGLVDVVVDSEQLWDTALNRARQLAEKAPLALVEIKRLVVGAGDWELQEGLHHEAEAFGRLVATEDSREGTGAFLQKRSARFRGR